MTGDNSREQLPRRVVVGIPLLCLAPFLAGSVLLTLLPPLLAVTGVAMTGLLCGALLPHLSPKYEITKRY